MTIAFRKTTIVRQPAMRDLPWCVMKRLACIAVGMAVLAAGCNVDEGSTAPQTLAPLGAPSETIPPTTSAAVETTAAVVAGPTTTLALPTGACVFAPPTPAAEITFETGTRLYGINPGDGVTGCLTELTLDNVGPLQWSPAGDRVLLNSITVFDGTQALPSKYFASNTRVR